MKRINIMLLCLGLAGGAAFAQQIHFNYDRSANFSAYKTYQWVDRKELQVGDPLLDQDLKNIVDTQFARKGLRRVESGADLHISYQGAISQEKEYDMLRSGPGPGWWGDGRVTSSTVEVGKLLIELFDAATGQLVWRGSAEKVLDIKKDPDKNYRDLEKAVAKLTKNYPPGGRKN